MKKVYTICDIFSIGDDDSFDQLSVYHYIHKKDALKAFCVFLKNNFGDISKGVQVEFGGKYISVNELFDDMVFNGYMYDAGNDRYFIRHEGIQEEFSNENLPSIND